MVEAFKAVKRNRGAAGIDKVSIEMFEANLEENLLALMRSLKDGTFKPHPLRRKYIPKEPGKFRPLGIPAVRDRVAQEVVRRLLDPIFERQFHRCSFGFRKRRGCHDALEKVLEFHRHGYMVVLDADIKGFFDNIPHKVIMNALAEEVADGNILRLVEKFLRSGVMEDGVVRPTQKGTPQGGVISPLLANITLNFLDWKLDDAGYRFVRYADDFVIVTKTRKQAKDALTLVLSILEELGLELSTEKTKITTYGKGYAFLGFDLSAHSRKMRSKSLKNFKDKIRGMTVRKQNFGPEVIEKLNPVIRGIANYFCTSFATMRILAENLDKWIRMRLRCMKFKRKSQADNGRLRLKHFKRLGLLSLRDLCY
jgi:group II intron reverse transcriptase/maturase